MHLVRLGLLVLPLLGLLLGCGPKNRFAPAQIRGVVKYKGEPLPGGNITFHSADKGSYSGPIEKGGTYSIQDVPEGEMAVTVETESVNPNLKVKNPGGKKGDKLHEERMAYEGKSGRGKMPPEAYRQIPEKYNSTKTSGLKATVTAGKQTKDFDLAD
ncbi:MAG: carboxypeptidase-like regulatory domain-containing protein [Gemmataceae bacterium]